MNSNKNKFFNNYSLYSLFFFFCKYILSQLIIKWAQIYKKKIKLKKKSKFLKL